MNTVKDYLGYENERNRRNADLYTRMVKAAYGDNNAVIIGHHVTFERDGDLTTENEIPSADTLIFDHDIARRIFGSDFRSILAELAVLDIEERDKRLSDHFERVMARRMASRKVAREVGLMLNDG